MKPIPVRHNKTLTSETILAGLPTAEEPGAWSVTDVSVPSLDNTEYRTLFSPSDAGSTFACLTSNSPVCVEPEEPAPAVCVVIVTPLRVVLPMCVVILVSVVSLVGVIVVPAGSELTTLGGGSASTCRAAVFTSATGIYNGSSANVDSGSTTAGDGLDAVGARVTVSSGCVTEKRTRFGESVESERATCFKIGLGGTCNNKEII